MRVGRELSKDKARQGQSLGWKTHGSPLKRFGGAAHALAVSTVDRLVYTTQVAKTIEGSAVLRCGRRVMLTPRFMVKYHCRPSQRLLRRLGGGYEVTVPTKMIGIMVEGFK